MEGLLPHDPNIERKTSMTFADHYPLDALLAVSHLSWWRASGIDSEIARRRQEAAKAGHPEWTAPAGLLFIQKEARAADAADQTHWEAAKKAFEAALTAHLEELRLAGRLAPTAGMRGREVWAGTAWNALVAGREPDHERRWLISSLAGLLTWQFVSMDDRRYSERAEQPLGTHRTPTRDQVVAAWEKICALLDAGDSDDLWTPLCVKDVQDQKTGDRCELHFRNWTGVLMRRNEKHALEPATDVGPIPLVAASFDVPTGDLLLTDFLRVDGMQEALDLGDEEYGKRFDLCSEEGRANRSAAHAERHRMGYCQTTNTSVSVWRHPDTGVLAVVPRWFGREEDEVDGSSPVTGWEKVGDFSCDMWRVTAVDAQVARELTSPETVDAYLSLREKPVPTKGLPVAEANRIGHDNCYAANVVRVPVRPGRWTMRCGDRFPQRMPRHRWGLPKGVKPWCVIVPPEAPSDAKTLRKTAR